MLWIGFGMAVAALLVVSRKHLALGMAVAAGILAAFTLSPAALGDALWRTISDPSVLLLAFVVGLIPLIGGVLGASGEMDRLVGNLRIGIRPFLALAPALLGMLPMPGGALLSAPLIERGAPHADPEIKAAANVWFRHILLLVYPLGPALIASAKIAGLNVYAVIPLLSPVFAVTLVLGYIFLLRQVDGVLHQPGPFSLRGLLVPLSILLTAPAIDVVLTTAASLPHAEISTVIGISASLAYGLGMARLRLRRLATVAVRACPWKYALIVLAMFAFLNVFQASGVPEQIAALSLPPVVLCGVVGFALGLITGRIQAPMSIIIPIYVTTYGTMSAAGFAVTYSAIFFGYVLTPIHPCISVSIEYFHTSMGPFIRRLAVPTIVGAAATIVVGLLVL